MYVCVCMFFTPWWRSIDRLISILWYRFFWIDYLIDLLRDLRVNCKHFSGKGLLIAYPWHVALESFSRIANLLVLFWGNFFFVSLANLLSSPFPLSPVSCRWQFLRILFWFEVRADKESSLIWFRFTDKTNESTNEFFLSLKSFKLLEGNWQIPR